MAESEIVETEPEHLDMTDYEPSYTPGEDSGEFVMVILEEDTPTIDGRRFKPGSVSWRELPLPLMYKTTNDGPGVGHKNSRVGGAITDVWKDGTKIYGAGHFSSGEDGQLLRELIAEGALTGVSADVGGATVELEADESGKEFRTITEGKIIMVTCLPGQAFDDSRISVTSAGGPLDPPDEWFANPNLTEPTALTVTEDGRIFGHAFTWGSCHVGMRDRCLTPPHSKSGYRYFAVGQTLTFSNDAVNTGVLTLDTDHAGITLSAEQSKRHYDHTGVQVADVAMGEDPIGGWFAGSLRSSLTPEQVRTIRGSAVSGDWRTIEGSLELVGLLVVNTPGFPVPRANIENHKALSLVASGVVTPCGCNDCDEAKLRRRALDLAVMDSIVEFYNMNHSPADGKFTSGGGSSGGAPAWKGLRTGVGARSRLTIFKPKGAPKAGKHRTNVAKVSATRHLTMASRVGDLSKAAKLNADMRARRMKRNSSDTGRPLLAPIRNPKSRTFKADRAAEEVIKSRDAAAAAWKPTKTAAHSARIAADVAAGRRSNPQAKLDSWMKQVDREISGHVGLGANDLADQPYADWHEGGMSPKAAARKALKAEGFTVPRAKKAVKSPPKGMGYSKDPAVAAKQKAAGVYESKRSYDDHYLETEESEEFYNMNHSPADGKFTSGGGGSKAGLGLGSRIAKNIAKQNANREKNDQRVREISAESAHVRRIAVNDQIGSRKSTKSDWDQVRKSLTDAGPGVTGPVGAAKIASVRKEAMARKAGESATERNARIASDKRIARAGQSQVEIAKARSAAEPSRPVKNPQVHENVRQLKSRAATTSGFKTLHFPYNRGGRSTFLAGAIEEFFNPNHSPADGKFTSGGGGGGVRHAPGFGFGGFKHPQEPRPPRFAKIKALWKNPGTRQMDENGRMMTHTKYRVHNSNGAFKKRIVKVKQSALRRAKLDADKARRSRDRLIDYGTLL